MLRDSFIFAFKNILHRKLRSFLTVLGIVIGVAAIIALITVSQGLERSLEEQFEKFGANRVTVFGGGVGDPSFRSQALTEKDFEKVDSLAEYEYVARWLTKNVVIEFGGEKKTVNVIGFDTDYSEKLVQDYDLSFSAGRVIGSQDSFSVNIGPKAAADLFSTEIRIRNNLVIAGKKFRVIGLFNSLGNPDDDNRVYVPIDTLRLLTDSSDEVTFLDGKTKPGADVAVVAAKTQRALEDIRDEEEFEVTTFEQLLGQINAVLGVVQAVLLGIAAISILVGGIGIMNSMYTSVLERTNEIGIMKSIGAQNKDIIELFLVESAVLGGVGGVLGVLVGSLIGKGVGILAQASGFGFLQVKVTFSVVVFGIVFAVVIGAFAGTWPARTAAKLQPVEALRA